MIANINIIIKMILLRKNIIIRAAQTVILNKAKKKNGSTNTTTVPNGQPNTKTKFISSRDNNINPVARELCHKRTQILVPLIL